MVNVFRVTCSDYTESIHERHQLRRVCLSFVIPYRCCVTTRLESTVNTCRDSRSSHSFQFLTGHRTRSILRTYDIHFNANVRTRMQRSFRSNTHCVAVENLLNSSQALAFVRDLFGLCVHSWSFNAQSFSSERLQLLTEGYRVRTASFHEFHFLWCESIRDVSHLFTTVVKLLSFSIDSQNRTSSN